MKKLIFVALFTMIFLPEIINASHYMGGEITWECMVGPTYTTAQQGRYRFHMKLYRECGGITFGSTETIITTVPGLPSISMSLKAGWPKDLSPQCHSTSLSIKCATAIASNTGAMSEYYYTSDGSYPNGVQLNGIPPANGWMFYNETCCRNPSTNVTNASSLGYRLRAIMYPYNNQNTYPCFDNSPTFAESPKPVMCSSYPSIYNHNATDKENDVLKFEWGKPLDQVGLAISGYAAGYSYLNPLPTITQNPNNIVSIDSTTGEIAFKSYTTGAFVTVTKVSAFRDNIKIAEIWRDVQLVITNCDSSSIPAITFINNGTNNLTKNVTIGDTILIDLLSYDITNPNLSFYAIGKEFGSFVPSVSGSIPRFDSIGCPKTPCATLMNAGTTVNPVTGNTIVSSFRWIAHPNHISPGKSHEEYNFAFYLNNGKCPVPNWNFAKLKVHINLPYVLTYQPKILSTEILNSMGDIKISFNPPNDPDAAFNQYEFFTSPTYNGTYILAGTLSSYNSNYYVHRNPLALNNEVYYYMRVKDVKNGQIRYSLNSDTVLTHFVDLSVDSLIYIHPSGGFTNVLMNISNKGNLAMSNFIVRYDVINGVNYSQYYTDTLFPGQSAAHSFPPVYSNDSGNVTICGNILHNKDFYVNNNLLCSQAFTSIDKLFNNGFYLSQNQPNPTKGKTNIQFTIPISGAVLIEIQNIMGQIIYSKKVNFDAGNQNIELNLEDFNSGVFFYSIEMMGYKQSKRMIILK